VKRGTCRLFEDVGKNFGCGHKKADVS